MEILTLQHRWPVLLIWRLEVEGLKHSSYWPRMKQQEAKQNCLALSQRLHFGTSHRPRQARQQATNMYMYSTRSTVIWSAQSTEKERYQKKRHKKTCTCTRSDPSSCARAKHRNERYQKKKKKRDPKILFSPGKKPEAFSVLDICDNQRNHENVVTWGLPCLLSTLTNCKLTTPTQRSRAWQAFSDQRMKTKFFKINIF